MAKKKTPKKPKKPANLVPKLKVQKLKFYVVVADDGDYELYAGRATALSAAGDYTNSGRNVLVHEVTVLVTIPQPPVRPTWAQGLKDTVEPTRSTAVTAPDEAPDQKGLPFADPPAPAVPAEATAAADQVP